MIILKILRSILLLPVWIIITMVWLMVHLVVFMMYVAGGILKTAFIIFAILAIAFGLWQNSLLFVLVTAGITVFLFGASFVDVLLEELRRLVGRTICFL